ncbi:MAG: LLM class flavin-dependent oxidoreductase [Anaerolineae bacterium]
MTIPLSILDVSPVSSGSTSAQALRNTIDLAKFADQRGFTRFWLAEHHNTASIASTTPDIMIGQVARETQHIRVGSGGVMLPNHAPLKVAESFKLLEALYPQRIDLGIGRAPGTDTRTALALRRSVEALNAEDFPQELAELQAFASGDFPADHPFKAVKAYPQDVTLPPIWLLGSSGFSSQLAAARGTGFAFAHHINGDAAIPAMLLYRQHFRPSAQFPEPHAILAVSAICADTDEEAEELALSVAFSFFRLYAGLPTGALPSPAEVKAYNLTEEQRQLFASIRSKHFVGSPTTVRAQLADLIRQAQADELMILTMVHDHAARLHSYNLVATEFELQPVAVAQESL